MKIVLLRHGKPDVEGLGKLRASELHKWIESYNLSGIHCESRPGNDAIHAANICNTVVCSDLRRSIESARLLGINEVEFVDPTFREVGLPYGQWKTPKASPSVWALMFRLLWFFGYSSNSEHHSDAKKRALCAARKLECLAKESGSVLHVGHGFMNKYIATSLLLNGWHGPKNPGAKYWEYGVYEFKSI